VVRNDTTTKPISSPARTQKLIQGKDFQWLKPPASKLTTDQQISKKSEECDSSKSQHHTTKDLMDSVGDETSISKLKKMITRMINEMKTCKNKSMK
jgi:hypothetical protein